jgi:hypothetical protein
MKENLKEQLESLEKHLKWCIDNNKPQEHLDLHIGVISDIKQENEQLKPKQRGLYEAIVEFIKWYNKNECLCKNPIIQKDTKQCGKCKLYINRVKHILLTQNNNHEK